MIAFYAMWKSSESRTQEMTYGWKRAEILGAVMNGCFLLALCLYIVLEAIPKFVEPVQIMADWWFIGTAAAGMVINFVATCIFAAAGTHGHSHAGGGGHGHSHGGGHDHAHKEKDHGHAHKDKDKDHGHAHKDKKDKEHGHAHKEKKDKEHGHAHKDKDEDHGHAHKEKKDKEHGHAHKEKKDKEHGHAHKDKEHKHAHKDKEHKHGHGAHIEDEIVVVDEEKEHVDMNMQAVFSTLSRRCHFFLNGISGWSYYTLRTRSKVGTICRSYFQFINCPTDNYVYPPPY
jgi:Co/Zn/Cd efflux system component